MPREADFQKFLRTSGQTLADIRARVRLDLLSDKLRAQVVAGHGQITDQAIEQYYHQHRSSFVEPETRSLRIVLTRRKADAQRVRAELERGASWKSVARRYSIDDESKRKGGRLAPLAEARWTARSTRPSSAPAKAGWSARSAPHRATWSSRSPRSCGNAEQSLTEVRKSIRQTLESEAQQAALDVFIQDFTARWRAKTECAEGYRTSDCRNGPAPAPTPVWDGNS